MQFSGRASEDYLSYYRSWPIDADGSAKDPRYAPPQRKKAYTAAWRAWCKGKDKKQWPSFIHQMILERQVLGAKDE